MQTNNSTASETLKVWIDSRFAEGKTVVLTNHLRSVRISAKTAASWASAGKPMFKLTADGLRVANGKSYDLIATPSTVLCRVSAVA